MSIVPSKPSIRSRVFGQLRSGRPVQSWILSGAGGMVLEAIAYGGIVTRLLVPDREGKLEDVVLGFNHLDGYLTGHPYFGAIIGRVAGRITNAQFDLDGKTYPLAANDDRNHVHGGVEGFDKKLWTGTALERADQAPSVQLRYVSRDGEEGYPGTVNVRVTYTVGPDNSFQIDTEATTDRATPLSLTHHSYFNLAGEGSGPITDHELQIHSDESVVTDDAMTLLQRAAVKGNDFNQPRLLGDAIPQLFQQHGDLYFIRKSDTDRKQRRLVTAARLVHHGSGRVMTVRTTEEYVQLYTGVSMPENLIGKSGKPYVTHGGLCLECEGYPDGANTPALGDIILRPGRMYRQTTVYAFSTE